ncbi:hypothetical protein AALD01_18110 [Oscillospiraceae bacterium 21-37]
MRYQILLLDIPDELHHALEHRFQGININFIIGLGTIAFQISTIFSSFFREISRKGILISKLGKNPANH